MILFNDILLKALPKKDHLLFLGKLELGAEFALGIVEEPNAICRLNGSAYYQFSHGVEKESWALHFMDDNRRDMFLAALRKQRGEKALGR